MKMRSQKLSLLLAFTTLLASGSISATTFARMSISTIARTAELIVRGRCISNAAAWDAGEIWTFTTFMIEETWKGAPTGAASQLNVRLLGGSLGNVASTVSGIPRFRPGEEAILFLEPNARGGFSIVSWAQGTFRIRREIRSGQEIVIQDTAAFDRFNPASRQFESVSVRNQPIESFRAQVQSALTAPTSGKK
jgi:hypothetical protein